MSVYIVPCNCGADEAERSKPRGNSSEIDDDLDMKNYRIVNFRQCGESRSDAATVEIVLDWVGALNNNKVDWDGGTI